MIRLIFSLALFHVTAAGHEHREPTRNTDLMQSNRQSCFTLGCFTRGRAIAILLGLAIGLQSLSGCGGETHSEPQKESEEHGEHPSEESGHDDHAGEEEDLEISLEVQERFAIATAPVTAGPVEVTLDLPGEVVPDPDRMVHVKPPFAGTIQRVFKHVGDYVEAGTPLAVVESAQALAPYTIRAGIAGIVTSEHAPVGESVDAAHELFTIGDTQVVWVHLQVFPGDLRRVAVGNAVEVLTPDATSGARGEISFISPVLDHATRTATARVLLENDGTYQPGLFVTGRVAIASEEAALSIPTSALVREGTKWVAFVREDEMTFARRPVEIGLRGIERSEIVSGLEQGDLVVTTGAFLVKSAAAREEMGGGHSH